MTIYSDYLQTVPGKYQSRVQRVAVKDYRKKPLGAFLADHLLAGDRQKWLILDPAGKTLGVNIRAVFWHSAIESLPAFWAAVEVLLYLVLMFYLLRRRTWLHMEGGHFRAVVKLVGGYLVAAALVFFIFLGPSYKNFLATTRMHLLKIAVSSSPGDHAISLIYAWDRKLEEDQKRFH